MQYRNAQTKISERFTCHPQNLRLVRIIVITWQSDMGCLETPATRNLLTRGPAQHPPNEGHTGHTTQRVHETAEHSRLRETPIEPALVRTSEGIIDHGRAPYRARVRAHHPLQPCTRRERLWSIWSIRNIRGTSEV